MARRANVAKRKLSADALYNDTSVEKFINKLMSEGKKNVAERVVYGMFDFIKEKTKGDPLKVFKKALDNVKPVVETKSRRVGGATYQVPVEVRPERKLALALNWLITYARGRGGRGMVEKLAGEVIDASNNRGGAVKKKEDVHKMADANKAFAHYKW